jgi:hypothetical protein
VLLILGEDLPIVLSTSRWRIPAMQTGQRFR